MCIILHRSEANVTKLLDINSVANIILKIFLNNWWPLLLNQRIIFSYFYVLSLEGSSELFFKSIVYSILKYDRFPYK